MQRWWASTITLLTSMSAWVSPSIFNAFQTSWAFQFFRKRSNPGLLRYGKCRFYHFQLKFGVQKSSKLAINKKWQIALNLINFRDVSCKSVSCSFYWGLEPSLNPIGIRIPNTTRHCLAWKMPSNVRFIIDYRKSSFSHFRMLKSDSTVVVLVKAFANPPQNIRKCSKCPFRSSHPVLKNVVWSYLSMRSLEPGSLL
jgi:hypothetical protein